MPDFLLFSLTHPLGQDLFCTFFNEGELPLPPVGSLYRITENNIQRATEDDSDRVTE
jgi:hypothetical protein